MFRAALLLLTVALTASGALAADYSRWERAPQQARELPFPRSERTQAIWAEGACWKECQIACTDTLDRCMRGSADQSDCIATADRCDRICQTDCRRHGGPLMPPIPQ